MKKIDYFWLRAGVHITAIVFAVQCIVEIAGIRKSEYGWVFWVSLCAFAVFVLCSVVAMVWNARSRT